jgi:hypothetical protein
MKTYSPKEQQEFRTNNRKESQVFADFQIRNNLDWPDGFDFNSSVELNEDQIEKVRYMLCIMMLFRDALKELHEKLPEGTYTQIFGDWNLLRIGVIKEELEEEND